MDETISITKSRSTKEMEETIKMADQTTQGIADKLTSIYTRIHDKSEKLKHHQEIVCTIYCKLLTFHYIIYVLFFHALLIWFTVKEVEKSSWIWKKII